MTTGSGSYDLFFRFIKAYASVGYLGIDRNDPLMIELEELMEINNQYFFVGDLFQGKILFTSKRSTEMIGIDPSDLNPYHNIEAAHPDEVYRNTNGWAKIMNLATDLFSEKRGDSIFSVNMKIRNPKGTYSEILFQCYLFYSGFPNNKVYDFQIHTNIDWYKFKKNRFHYYVGTDLSNFRYPDEELLTIGNPLSDREFEIVRLIEAGLSTEQTADKLFLSVYTINTHRSNILSKTGFNTISELIIDYQKRGLI
jgi:DNA-binding CsgD family transcriptional regulator